QARREVEGHLAIAAARRGQDHLDGDAWNPASGADMCDLAEALHQAGHHHEAAETAATAIRLLGDAPSVYLDTARRIRADATLAAADGSDRVPTLVALASTSGAAFAELVEEFAPLIASFIRAHRLFGDDAADVAQHVWATFAAKSGEITNPAAVAGWLRTTTHRECLAVLERQGRTVPTEGPWDGWWEDPEPVDPQERKALGAAMAGLSGRELELVGLLIDGELSYDEIAEKLGMPRGSIGPTRARALAKLERHPAIRKLR
ncbi:MAG TPA: sigma-70 family RNA polymerase sigma factor, partial [Acidimicrobiales bacterium]